MKNPRCGGCPPCCKQCVFESKGEEITGQETIVQTAAEYGCKQGFGNIVKDACGRIGQVRGKVVHYLDEAGKKFLKETKNPLLQLGN